MKPEDFLQQHYPAVEADQVRHNVLVSTLDRYVAGALPKLRYWSLGAPGAFAAQAPGGPLVLGDLDEDQCARLAELTRDIDYSAVSGPDLSADWFTKAATDLGLSFGPQMPQAIHALSHPPTYPKVDGIARFAIATEDSLLAEWIISFCHEALPEQSPPASDQLRNLAASKRYVVWDCGGQPVSMAGIFRRTKSTLSITPVYTPPERRGRGYAGGVVAHLVELAFAEGKKSACLYTDLRNPNSNRCYTKIGFRPVCRASYYARLL